MTARVDITGRRFGRLTVLGFSHLGNARPKAFWVCHCDCGRETIVVGEALKSGNTVSCGCLKREKSYKHGHADPRSRTYRTWDAMMRRCNNPNDRAYKRYGGKGIQVCERWHSFVNFLADMGERPPGMTLHRLNHNGHYEPSNCEWRTPPH